MSEEPVSSTIRHGELVAHLVRPAEPGDRGVLLLPMITGIGQRVREFATELAGAGLTTLCWDPFHGPSSDTHTIEDLRDLRDRLDDHSVLDEQQRLLDFLHGPLGVRSAGAIGYCLGGRFALLLAAEDYRIASVVGYHPTVPPEPEPNHSLDPFAAAEEISAPVLIHYPGKDHLVPYASLRRLESALRTRARAATSVHFYPEAGHGFSDSAHHGDERNVAAYRLAHAQTMAFLTATLA